MWAKRRREETKKMTGTEEERDRGRRERENKLKFYPISQEWWHMPAAFRS